jgi:hypothetical protein
MTIRYSNSDKQRDKQSAGDDNAIIIVSKWSVRFTWAAIIQGAVVAVLTAMLAIIVATSEFPHKLVQMMLVTPSIGFSEISALAGLGLYLVVGVIGTGLTAQFYHHFEVRLAKPYRGLLNNGLAWVHLVLMNIGIAAASIMMIYAGYIGDVAVSPAGTDGGFGMTAQQAADKILNPFIVPVAIMLLVTVAGAVAGGAGFLLNNFRKK